MSLAAQAARRQNPESPANAPKGPNRVAAVANRSSCKASGTKEGISRPQGPK
jgi:hypothetical protein